MCHFKEIYSPNSLYDAHRFIFIYSIKCHFHMNTTLHTRLRLHTHTHTHTYMHTKPDRYARPFPAGPCRCSRNSRVGLSGKQTVRGCWESSLGLQIIVRLTKVSEPAPLLLHTHTHTHTYCICTPTSHACAHISTWPVHIKGTIEAHFKSTYTIRF